jgi:hypothetical protein
MKIDCRFACKAKSVDETPEPFREQLKKHLKPHEEISLLVCAPAYLSLRETFLRLCWLSPINDG